MLLPSVFTGKTRDAEAEWPPALTGRNLIVAGDSNDRLFFTLFCSTFHARPAYIGQPLQMSPTSPYGEANVTFPHESATRVCHIRKFNASVIFFFHFGLMGESPEPPWHAESMRLRTLTHLAKIGETHLMIPVTDLVRFLWPLTVNKHLPKRPLIFLTQSSLWDSVCFDSEGSHDNKTALTMRDLRGWRWLDRAARYLNAVLQSSLGVERILWRTNPDCPVDNGIVKSTSGLQSTEIKRLQVTGSMKFDIVDWRGNYVVQDASSCKGIHYTRDGYEAYAKSLAEVLVN